MNVTAGTLRAEPAAPADVLRDVAHELRQPLSTIESIAYYLAMFLPATVERAHAQLAVVRQLVEVSLGGSDRSPIRLALAGSLAPLNLDPSQVRELAETLVMLARQLPCGEDVAISTSASASGGAEVVLTAPGHSNVSAFGSGSTLGLENARRIIENHGGTLALEAAPETGIRLRVMLP
jgi:signal transduction histidine kinase